MVQVIGTEIFFLLSLRIFQFSAFPSLCLLWVNKEAPSYSRKSIRLRIPALASNRPLKFLTSLVMQAGFIQCSLQSSRPARPRLGPFPCRIRQLRSCAIRVVRILQIRGCTPAAVQEKLLVRFPMTRQPARSSRRRT